jgi:hypothetical protein
VGNRGARSQSFSISPKTHQKTLNVEFVDSKFKTYFPTWELPGSSLVELRIKANSEAT